MHVLHGAQAAAHGEGHEALVRGALDDVDHRGAVVGRGGDVEEHHLIGALLVVLEREGDGIADVAQFARLGFAELHAAGDIAVVNIETRDDAFGKHGMVFQ